jgi:hypothetical protein
VDCPACSNERLELVVIREDEDKRVWTYFCERCLSYLNQHYDGTELMIEEWGSLHGKRNREI